MKDLLTVLNQLPPYQVRLLALDGRRPLSTRELALKSGLSRATIKTLTRSESWYPFELSTIIKFTKACNIDLLHQKAAHKKLLRMMKAQHGPPHLNTPQRKFWSAVFAGEKQWRQAA